MFNKKKSVEKSKTSGIDALKEKFEKVNKPVTRRVKVYASSCCGCGCYNELVWREVPYDSDIQDYDHVGNLQKNDKFVDD